MMKDLEINGSNPQFIAELLRTSTSAKNVHLSEDGDGDPMIIFEQNHATQVILFYNRIDRMDNQNYSSMQFRLTLSDTGHTAETIRAYNRKIRFAKAYLDDDNDSVLVMDVLLSQNISVTYLEEIFTKWDEIVFAFIVRTAALDLD